MPISVRLGCSLFVRSETWNPSIADDVFRTSDGSSRAVDSPSQDQCWGLFPMNRIKLNHSLLADSDSTTKF